MEKTEKKEQGTEKKEEIELNKKTETKKLEEFKENMEDKKITPTEEKKVEEKKEKSKPAVIKKLKKKKKEKIVELEREYIVPLRRGFLNVPPYRRAKKAIRVLKEFMVRHMNVRDGDLRKVKIDRFLNNEIWFRGIKKPLNKVKVLAKKIEGVVYVELADVPDIVRYKINWEEKRRAAAEGSKKKPKEIEKKAIDKDKDKDGVDDKIEESEDEKSGSEKAASVEKGKTKELKHTTEGKHMKKTTPVRKALKK